MCAENLRRFCSGCRLRQCLEVGMKANYVRELNIKRIRRRIEKIPKHQRLLKFSETLDPFQVLSTSFSQKSCLFIEFILIMNNCLGKYFIGD